MARRPKALKKTFPIIWKIVRYFSPYIKEQRHIVFVSMIALVAGVVFRLLEPWPIKYIFDYILMPSSDKENIPIRVLEKLEPVMLLTILVIGFFVFTSLRAISSYINTVGFAIVGIRVLTQVRERLYRHLQYLSLSFHTKARTGDLTIRVISDVGILRDITVTSLLPFLGNIMILVGMVIVMFLMQWQLALMALAIVPLFWLRTTTISRRIHEFSRRQRQREGAMASTAAESISAIKVVQALSLQETFSKVFSSQNKKSLNESVKVKRLTASLERSVDVLVAAGTALVLWYGARLVLRGELTPGDILVFLTYLKSAFKPVRDFAKYTSRLAKGAAAGERVLDLLEQKPEIRDLPGAVRAPRFEGNMSFEGVTFAYESGRNVLNNIVFQLRRGQHVAIVGPSGNGKSTLVSLILRLYDSQEGRITIDGKDIRDYTIDSLRSQISVVLQDTLLFAATVRENIAYGAPDATFEDIKTSARLANAHGFIEALSQGYETILSERGATLSNGQRQRIAIARAAIRKSPILILDEPTTSLDEENEQIINEAIDRLCLGRTTFLITHNLQYASKADLILFLQDGNIIECGSHYELIEAKGRYAALYHLQAGSEDVNIDQEGYYALTT